MVVGKYRATGGLATKRSRRCKARDTELEWNEKCVVLPIEASLDAREQESLINIFDVKCKRPNVVRVNEVNSLVTCE
jgi:hypothetical protein